MPAEDKFREACGLFGVVGTPSAAEWCYLGLYALQHRGQESAGIVVSDGESIVEHRGMGLVYDVFDEESLGSLAGHMAIGHNRYSTMGLSRTVNIQPFSMHSWRGLVCLAHNGNLVNASRIRRRLESEGSIFQTGTDSEVIVHLLARSRTSCFEDALGEALGELEGAYSLLLMTRDRLYAVRDPWGFRPLCMGRAGSAIVVASESCALDVVGASFERELDPGELVVVSEEDGVVSMPLLPAQQRAQCIFELIYFARPDSVVFGKPVSRFRRELGRALAAEQKVDADVVISVPDSSNEIALGYAQGSGLPMEFGLIRNHYVGRTFIYPIQSMRAVRARIKYNAVGEVLGGRRVVVVDDSIVRGTTMRRLVSLIRNGGAREVHLRVGSPPICNPCWFGIDTPSSEELIASGKSPEEIASFLGVDSLGYLSREALLDIGGRENGFCSACFGGAYPMEMEGQRDKAVLEPSPRSRGGRRPQ
ncbi:MAG: amidophosphoribosyltransferase [Candidatus Eisenbacteria sp.]|nr:amidophosphoribosyltransferase [Candidatus Eisenbacteria bacterium]